MRKSKSQRVFRNFSISCGSYFLNELKSDEERLFDFKFLALNPLSIL